MKSQRISTNEFRLTTELGDKTLSVKIILNRIKGKAELFTFNTSAERWSNNLNGNLRFLSAHEAKTLTGLYKEAVVLVGKMGLTL